MNKITVILIISEVTCGSHHLQYCFNQNPNPNTKQPLRIMGGMMINVLINTIIVELEGLGLPKFVIIPARLINHLLCRKIFTSCLSAQINSIERIRLSHPSQPRD